MLTKPKEIKWGKVIQMMGSRIFRWRASSNKIMTDNFTLDGPGIKAIS
jgi:hypothetical protein